MYYILYMVHYLIDIRLFPLWDIPQYFCCEHLSTIFLSHVFLSYFDCGDRWENTQWVSGGRGVTGKGKSGVTLRLLTCIAGRHVVLRVRHGRRSSLRGIDDEFSVLSVRLVSKQGPCGCEAGECLSGPVRYWCDSRHFSAS